MKDEPKEPKAETVAEAPQEQTDKGEDKEPKEKKEGKRKGKRKNEEIDAPVPPPVRENVVIPLNPVPQYGKVLSTHRHVTYQRLYLTFTNDIGYLAKNYFLLDIF